MTGGVFPLRVRTARLALRRLTLDDAGFILDLFNEEVFVRQIGDKGVLSLEDARRYLRQGPIESYRGLGFGMNGVELATAGRLVGICGLRTRDAHDDVEIGFAMLAPFRRRGYAREAAEAVIDRARAVPGLRRIAAIVNPDNRASIDLLRDLGFARERKLRLARDQPELDFFARAL